MIATADTKNKDGCYLYCPTIMGYECSNSMTKSFTSKTLATELAKIFKVTENSFRLNIGEAIDDAGVIVYELTLAPIKVKKDIVLEDNK